MKRTADINQRHLRWSLGYAPPELAGAQLDTPVVGRLVRPTSLRNLFASRGSAFV